MFPKIFVKEMSGKFGLQCVLNFLQAYLATSIFNTNAVFWGIYISQLFLAFGRDIFQKVAGYMFFLGRYHPRVFNERFAKQIPPEEKVDARGDSFSRNIF